MRAVAGVGIGLRRELFDAVLSTRRTIDWLEVITENFLGLAGRPAALLERFRDSFALVPHGVGLSVGSSAPAGYLDALVALVAHLDPPWFSDHLCFAFVDGRTWFDLLPLPRHDEAVARAAGNARAAQRAVGRPLILENITTYAQMPGSSLTEAQFLDRVAAEADVGLLLDLNNLYVNAINHGQQPEALLEEFPLGRVRQIHLAGHSREGSVLLDTHAAPVSAPVWDLYVRALKRCGPVPTLVEWDHQIPSLDAVLDEADRARTLLERHG